MGGTILSQGSFIAPATIIPVTIQVPSGIDWMRVLNYTTSGSDASGGDPLPIWGIEYYWQRGMPAGGAYVNFYVGDKGALFGNNMLYGGFNLYDPTGLTPGSQTPLGLPVPTFGSSDSTQPVVITSSTFGMFVGSVVRMSSTNQTDINGIDMVVSAITPDSSFTLLGASNALANNPGAAGGAGFYTIVNTAELFYPRRRYVTDIINGPNPLVSTSVAHGMTPGQTIRFSIPTLTTGASGMIELDEMYAIVTQVQDDYSFNINIDTSLFSPFVWPTISQQPSSFPIMIPFGEDTATALSSTGVQIPTIAGIQIPNTQSGILADAVVNTGFIGMTLGALGVNARSLNSITGPAGSNPGDLLLWTAGKAVYGGY
jgi:hypothetical protein